MNNLMLALLLALSACGVITTPEKIAKASEVCKLNDGVKDIYIGSDSYFVTCNNGGKFNVDTQ